jgi:hypothetical protein
VSNSAQSVSARGPVSTQGRKIDPGTWQPFPHQPLNVGFGQKPSFAPAAVRRLLMGEMMRLLIDSLQQLIANRRIEFMKDR